MKKIVKYYVVAKGAKPGIYLSWAECKRYTHGISGARFKSFTNQNEAEAYYAEYHNGKLPSQKGYIQKASELEYDHTTTCVLCGRPYKLKNGYYSPICRSCKHKQKNIKANLLATTGGSIKRLSADELLFIKKQYKCDDVFSFISTNPTAVLDAKEHAKNGDAQREHNSQKRQNQVIDREEIAPAYVMQLLGESKEFKKISGDKRAPQIVYHCKLCDKDFCVSYRNLIKHKGHKCSSLLSSGEGIIKDFLKKEGIPYLTQQDTLKCINPDTGYPMPYDFEIPSHKIIIEVQGEQHRTFIPWFHGDISGFHYQQKKDAYKKKFAEERGYKVIEIWYETLETGEYKNTIKACLV